VDDTSVMLSNPWGILAIVLTMFAVLGLLAMGCFYLYERWRDGR
jgi:hypothetical protein